MHGPHAFVMRLMSDVSFRVRLSRTRDLFLHPSTYIAAGAP